MVMGINEYKIGSIHKNGFTLIEILIAVAIIGVLAAIAYPSYQNYVIKTKRTDMMSELQQMASRIEAQKINYKKYDKIPLSTIYNTTPANGKIDYPYSGTSLYEVSVWNVSVTPKVQITTNTLSTTKWQLQAKPKTTSIMKGDGNLTINYKGEKCRGNSCNGEEWR